MVDEDPQTPEEKLQKLVQETNKYTSEKTTAQAFLNTGLFTANATNLANLYSASARDDFTPERLRALKGLLICSMVLQFIAFGVFLYVYTKSLDDSGIERMVKSANSGATLLVGVITLLNIIITAFGTSGVTTLPSVAPAAVPMSISSPVA
jgi:hypothetical protein